MSDPIRYFVKTDDEQKGPFTLAQLQAMWKAGSVTLDTQYWFEGQVEWMPLSTIVELLETTTTPTRQMYAYPASFGVHGVQTIEVTGKKWKGAQLVGGLAMCVGVVIGFMGFLIPIFLLLGGLLFIGGLVVLVTAKIGAWWHHG